MPAGMIVHNHAMRRMDGKANLGPGAGRTASSGGSAGFSKCEVYVGLHIYMEMKVYTPGLTTSVLDALSPGPFQKEAVVLLLKVKSFLSIKVGERNREESTGQPEGLQP